MEVVGRSKKDTVGFDSLTFHRRLLIAISTIAYNQLRARRPSIRQKQGLLQLSTSYYRGDD